MDQVLESIDESTNYTTGQAAEFLGVNVQTIRNWIEAGALAARPLNPANKRSRKVIQGSTLIKFLQDSMQQAPPRP